jgi:hypothetical protein
MVIAVIVVVVIAYALHHGKHYRRNRRRGLNVWISCRGPWGTRISKRL